jgi:2-methylcitrate dehydratase PrpD
MGRLVAETAAANIPEAVVQRAKVSLLHNIVVGLAARYRDNIGQRMAGRYWPEPPEATLLGNGARVSAEGAAFANAALMNARSQDATHAGSTSHPGSPTLAAAMAVAEAHTSTGSEFLVATILGVEVLCRIGRDFDHLIAARSFRPAAVLAGFGAIAATARLTRLTAEQTAHALGLGANLAGGLSQVWLEGSAEAPLQLAFAARNGIAIARAAACGARAAVHAFEGEAGFYRAFAGASSQPFEALDGVGRHWQLSEITLKTYPVCAILQGPVGLVLDLMAADALTSGALAEIVLELNPYEAAYPGIDHAGPFASSVTTKMSAQFCLALAAIDGRITPDGLGRVGDGQVLATAACVKVVANPAIEERRCRIRLGLRDGRVVSGSVDAPVGQPSYDDVVCFARSLAEEIGTTTFAIQLLADVIAGIDRAAGIGGLMTAAVACGA